MDKRYAEYLLLKTRNDYDQIAKEFSSSRAFLWKELIPLADHINPKDRVLDLGCGNGRLYSLLKSKNIEYIGVDSSRELIKIAKEENQEGNPKFLTVEALSLPFPDNYFDKIFSIAVLHHIPSEEFRLKFLEEIKRVLKPKGLLILTVWNLWQKKNFSWFLIKYTILRIFGKSKLENRDIFYPWKDFEKRTLVHRYFHCFKRKELDKLIIKAGFNIKEIGFLSRGKAKKINIYSIIEK